MHRNNNKCGINSTIIGVNVINSTSDFSYQLETQVYRNSSTRSNSSTTALLHLLPPLTDDGGLPESRL